MSEPTTPAVAPGALGRPAWRSWTLFVPLSMGLVGLVLVATLASSGVANATQAGTSTTSTNPVVHPSTTPAGQTTPTPAAAPASGGPGSAAAPLAPPAEPARPQAAALQPVGQYGWVHLVLDSEFSGSSLPSPWSTGWFGSTAVNSAETNCYAASMVSVAAGNLALSTAATPSSCGGVTQPFTSGLVSTKDAFTFTYGYFEARILLPPGSSGIADWPAFWADGPNWPTTGEIDVLEGLGGDACAHYHDAAGAFGACVPGAGYAGGWHTFGADWEPGSITYFYDGVQIWQDTSGISSSPMYLIMNLSTSSGIPATAATMNVADVRVWQH